MTDGATSAQVDALGREMVDLRSEVKAVRKALRKHEREHQREETARLMTRRRLWGAAVVLVASVDTPVLTLLFSRR